MGVEWINRTHRTFTRSIAKARSHVLTPRLDDVNTSDVQRSFRVRLDGDQKLEPGAPVLVRADHNRVALLDGDERVIGQSEEMPDWLSKLVGDGAEGFACGVVDGINAIAGTADVRLQTGAS